MVTTLLTACSSKSPILGKWKRLPIPISTPESDFFIDLGYDPENLSEEEKEEILEEYYPGDTSGISMEEIFFSNKFRIFWRCLTFSIEGDNILILTYEDKLSMQYKRVK